MRRRGAVVLEPHAAADLAAERRRRVRRRPGSASGRAPQRSVRPHAVGPVAGQRGGAEPGADRRAPRRRRRPGPSGRRSGSGARRARRSMSPIERSRSAATRSGSARSSRMWSWVCDPIGDEAGGVGVAQGGPRQDRPSSRNDRPCVDEVGGQVERDREAVLDQDRQRLLDEVGGAVVEGDHHRRVVGLGRAGPGHELVEVEDRSVVPAVRHHRHVRREGRRADVDRARLRAADLVVGQHDRAGGRTGEAVVATRRVSQGPRHDGADGGAGAHGVRIGR